MQLCDPVMVRSYLYYCCDNPVILLSCLLADETIVPPDVPSYLSSQGTLSDRQETVVRTEGGHQANGHIESNGKFRNSEAVDPDAPSPG